MMSPMDSPMVASDSVESRAAAVVVLFLAVAVALWAISVAVAGALPSDPGAVPDALRGQFFWPSEYLRPEPSERTVFLVDLLLLPALGLGGAWLVGRVRTWRPELSALGLPIIACGVAVLATNAESAALLRSAGGAGSIFLAVIIALVCLGVSARGGRMDVGRGRTATISLGVLLTLAVFFSFAWRTLPVRDLGPGNRYDQHLDAVLYTISQATRGRVAIADYTSQYGFFGSVLAPWFRLAGTSVLAVTVTLNALQALALAAIAAFVFREFKHLPLAIGACLAVFFFENSWAALMVDADPYFQYTPVRLLFPAISVFLVSEWIRRPRRSVAIVISLAAGVALIWNLDTGVAVAGSWLTLLGYQAASAAVARENWRARLATTASSLIVIMLPVLFSMAWIRWRAVAPVDFSLALQSQRLFYGAGFFMLPMSTGPHPWQVVAGVLVFGIIIGSLRILGVVGERRSLVVLHVALLGLGLFPYYQGRSHDRVLISVAWPAVLVAFLLADWAWELAQARRVRRWIAFGVAAPVLAFGALCGLLQLHDVPGIVRVARQRLRGTVRSPWLQQNIALVRDASAGRSDVVVLARFQGVIFAETRLVSSVRGPGNVEVITHAQADGIVRAIVERQPAMVFVGEPYLTADDANPFRALLPWLGEHYMLKSRTTGSELRLYTAKGRGPP